MLRPATDQDQTQVLAWRNHPQVRAVSLTQHLITEQEHASWWSKVKNDPRTKQLIYERQGTPCGVVTFFDYDAEKGTSWWGYYLDNDGLEKRGELLPAWIQIQREAVRYAFRELGLQQLDAEVLEANEAVRRFNTRNKFIEIDRHSSDLGQGPQTVIHVRRLRQPEDDN